MVGFFRESSNQEEESCVNQQKLKISNCPENFRFDFEDYSSEFGGFSVASAEPFLDFDSIKDWIEEMQVPDSVESSKAEIRSGVCVESCLENQISGSSVDFGQGMNGSEKLVSVKVECSDSGENMDNKGGRNGDNSLVDLDGMKDSSMLGGSENGEVNLDGHHDESKASHGDESGIGVLGDENCHKAETLGCLTEEALEKVTLVGNEGGVVVAGSDMLKGGTPAVDEDSSMLGSSENGEVNLDGHHDETKASHGDESGIGVLGDENCHKAETLGCSIEEGLEKVNLIGNEGGVVIAGSDMLKGGTPAVDEDSDNDSDSDMESDCETSSSSSASSSSTSNESDDDVEKGEVKGKEMLCKTTRETTKRTIDMEEGQIMDSDDKNILSRSVNNEDEGEDDDTISNKYNEEFQFVDDADDEEDVDVVKGPIKSKNELKVLPPVPPVNVTLQSCHEILPVGVVSSVLGAKVIVEGSEKHDPLSEGSILWVSESRLPLGLVDEIFGPVKTPFYIVRHNTESEVPSGIQNGTLVGYVSEFVGHVLNDKNLYQKGYDASGDNDEEVSEEFYFSDDEKEAEYKRLLRMSKRGSNNQGQGSDAKKKNWKKKRSGDKSWIKDQPSPSQSLTVRSSQSSQMQQSGPRVPPSREGNQLGGPSRSIGPVFPVGPTVHPSSQGNQLGPSNMSQFFPNPPMAFPQQMQQAEFLLNGLLQQQNMAGFQMNSIPWQQQNHPQNFQVPWQQQQQQQQQVSQMPLSNPAQCQQPFDLSQLVAGAAATPLGPPANFSAMPTNAPWLGMFGQNLPNQVPQSPSLVGQNVSNQAQLNLGLQGPNVQMQSFNSQPPANFQGNDGAYPQFSQGFSSGRGGRGRGRRPVLHRGGGRGRH